jgi:hypothetical protein
MAAHLPPSDPGTGERLSHQVFGGLPVAGASQHCPEAAIQRSVIKVGETGRVVLIAPATARAMAAYLRARRYHRLADSPFVWLGLRGDGPLDGTGLYRMLRRRADQAGYVCPQSAGGR